MSAFSERLSMLRTKKGWSKTHVAKLLGIRMQTYANYEYGSREPDFEVVSKIAELYSVTVDYLLNGQSKERVELSPVIDDSAIFTYEGKRIPKKDLELIKRILETGEYGDK
ncbi:helix-turn-helix domain-containing protein [Ligilactobacillus sp. LYQ60]|uniref:helix-turn-helix domain-containing protein n=1 Tax=Ligilactobacillus sp. LYQ60 TaxID=3378799 RepID=UPI0038522E17